MQLMKKFFGFVIFIAIVVAAVSFLPDIFFMALSGILFVAHYVYQLVLILLSRIYTKKGL